MPCRAVHLRPGRTGHGYEALLGGYLAKASVLVLEELCAIRPAQWQRFQELCGVLRRFPNV
eukprot:4926791-Lingulodinium_polyedra.AAC.1